MAKYTMELRRIVDIFGRNEVESWFSSYNLADFLTPEQIQQIQKYNVWSKEKLASQIVDHYYMREIGFETPALFKHYAKLTMNEIMGSYLLKIYTQFLEYDPLSSVDYTEEYTREIEGSSEGSSNSNSQNSAEGFNINNDTPQQRITKQNLDSGIYASTTNQSETSSQIQDETNTEASSKTVEKYTHSMKGDNGVIVTNQYLVREFRELATNFNLEIINELNKLFMGLY
jgi:hypothetical protein